MMDSSRRGPTVAYVPFKTFLSAIERMERHLPNQVDNSLWPSYSGAIRSQLLGSFRFLRLIDDEDRPTSALKAIVENRPQRRVAFRKVIEASYRPILSLDLERVTPRQFREAMNKFSGVTGATQKRVISFFLGAAKYAEMPVAPVLARNIRSPRARSKSVDVDRADYLIRDARAAALNTSKTVRLDSGMELTLSLSGNPLELSPGDRDFVFRMIDELQAYRKSSRDK